MAAQSAPLSPAAAIALCIERHPNLCPQFTEILNFHKSRLYHQMTEALLALFADSVFSNTAETATLYDTFVSGLLKVLNGRAVVRMAVTASRWRGDDAIPRLKALSDELRPISDDSSVRATGQSSLSFVWVYPLCEVARLHIAAQARSEAKAVLETVSGVLDSIVEMDPILHAFYYLVKAEYCKGYGPPEGYYTCTLLYFACKPVDTIPQDEQCALAFMLCISALIAEKLYAFGSLLSHDVLKSLGTHAWIADLTRAVHYGDVEAYNNIIRTRAARLNQQRPLILRRELMGEKVLINAVVARLAQLPATARVASFAELAAATRGPVEDIESLLMRALSLGLIRGSIDQVAERVVVTWMAPRVLDKAQMAALDTQLGDWAAGVDTALGLLDAEAPELFAL